jgi:hypothetical protein
MNNIFDGGQSLVEGPSTLQGNLTSGDPQFIDQADYDYRLRSGSPAVDAGVEPIAASQVSLRPTQEYRHPRALQPRPAQDPLDAGAYEAATN